MNPFEFNSTKNKYTRMQFHKDPKEFSIYHIAKPEKDVCLSFWLNVHLVKHQKVQTENVKFSKESFSY